LSKVHELSLSAENTIEGPLEKGGPEQLQIDPEILWVESLESAGSVEAVEAVEAVECAGSAGSVEAVEAVECAGSAGSVGSVEAVEAVEAVECAESAGSVESAFYDSFIGLCLYTIVSNDFHS